MLTDTPSGHGTGRPHRSAASSREIRAPSPHRRTAATQRSPCPTGTRASAKTPRNRRRTSALSRSLRLNPAARASSEVNGSAPSLSRAARRRAATLWRDGRAPDEGKEAEAEGAIPPASRFRAPTTAKVIHSPRGCRQDRLLGRITQRWEFRSQHHTVRLQNPQGRGFVARPHPGTRRRASAPRAAGHVDGGKCSILEPLMNISDIGGRNPTAHHAFVSHVTTWNPRPLIFRRRDTRTFEESHRALRFDFSKSVARRDDRRQR